MVGESQGKAGKRRQWVRIEKEMARLDREALWLERVTVSNTGNVPCSEGAISPHIVPNISISLFKKT